MTFINIAMDELLSYFSDTVTVYPSKGLDSGEDDFWHEDLGWDEENGEEYEALVEEVPSEETLERAGFMDEAEMGVWFGDEVVGEGDLIDYYGSRWIVISTTTFRAKGQKIYQLAGVMSDES